MEVGPGLSSARDADLDQLSDADLVDQSHGQVTLMTVHNAKGLEFDVIIACVLGGTDINGGRGTIFGTLIGALIIGVLSNAMNLMGLAIYHQDVVRGIVLVCAILMHRLISSRIR